MSYHFVETRRSGHRFAGLAHHFDMSVQSLESHILGLVECPTGGDAAWKIRKADAEIAVGSL
jgi:hypothetical protein